MESGHKAFNLFELLSTQQASVIPSWELCTDNIRFYHDAGSMIPYHKNLTSKGYRALIYR